MGAIVFYETVNEHMRVPNEGLRASIGQAELALREIKILKKVREVGRNSKEKG